LPKPVARVGDPVPYVCVRGDSVFSGTGQVIQGSSRSKANGSPLARSGDQCDCGPCGIGVIQATAKNLADGVPIARQGDNVQIVAGFAFISQGSPDVSSD
jgi:hypothetical protein